ncbi:hypothetical protein H8S66_18745 [Pseudomonas lurida]|uniref:hypothetical protein n=1 Tax=Pseudomonas lurida TaxID=244566 RepID=UPI001654A89D|nr:hypothetical protein [Pseudomonas lurida]MBC3924918.1 hypothetical protein [Pseudomonas lurida]
MESNVTTLGICQEDARAECLLKSNEAYADLQRVFLRSFNVFNDAMQGIWNNYELMTDQSEGGVHRIIAGSGDEGVREREIFESILSVVSVSLTPIKRMIFEGSYVSACVLLRNSVEATIQLRKVLEGQYKTGEIGRISKEDERIRKIYGEITGLAHLFNDVFLSDVTKGHSANQNHELLTPMFRVLTPQFNFGLGQALFALHIICTVEAMSRINMYFKTYIPQKKLSEENLGQLEMCRAAAWQIFAD